MNIDDIDDADNIGFSTSNTLCAIADQGAKKHRRFMGQVYLLSPFQHTNLSVLVFSISISNPTRYPVACSRAISYTKGKHACYIITEIKATYLGARLWHFRSVWSYGYALRVSCKNSQGSVVSYNLLLSCPNFDTHYRTSAAQRQQQDVH